MSYLLSIMRSIGEHEARLRFAAEPHRSQHEDANCRLEDPLPQGEPRIQECLLMQQLSLSCLAHDAANACGSANENSPRHLPSSAALH